MCSVRAFCFIYALGNAFQGASDPILAFGKIDASVACRVKGNVSLMAEDYDIVGTQDINTEAFKEFSVKLMQKVSGIKSVWLLIKGQGISIDWFGFE